jgi:amino acid adenylation domain-containing protein
MNIPVEVERYRLTPLQGGMLYHRIKNPADDIYAVQVSCLLEGEVDAARLKRAAQLLVDRYDIFRSGILWEHQPHPVQVVYSTAQAMMTETNLCGMAPAEQHEAIQDFLAEDRARGFALGRPPLIRFALFRLDRRIARLVWTVHHIVLDAWSTPLVLSDLFRLYSALGTGLRPVMTPPPPFRNYVHWLSQQDGDAARRFWKQELADLEPISVLKAQGSRPLDEPTTAARHCLVEIRTPQLVSQMTAFARRSRVTMNTVVQAAWAVALARRTGAREAFFAMTTAARPESLEGVDQAAGLYLNALPVRVRFRGGAIVPWLQDLQNRQASAREHDVIGLAQIMADQRLVHRDELFESMLSFEGAPWSVSVDCSDAGFAVTHVAVIERTHYPLSVVVVVDGDQFHVKIVYDSRRVSSHLAAGLADGLIEAVRSIVSPAPEAGVLDLLALSSQDKKRVTVEFNRTSRPYPREQSIDLLVLQQAERRPNAVAVRCDGEALTYRELDERANQVAHALSVRGFVAGDRIGLNLDRSIETIIHLLGVLKIGATYVPLDPAYPAERLRFMAREANLKALLTRDDPSDKLAGSVGAPLIFIDRELRLEAARAPRGAVHSRGGESPAYVMYTSGSTGQPKGVLVPHRAVVRLVKANTYAVLDASTVVLHLAPLAFDASTFEIWGPLAAGGEVAIFAGRHGSLSEIGHAIRTHRVNTMFMTAALFHLFVEHGIGHLRPLRQLLVGGEVVSHSLMARALQQLEGVRLSNIYGPTESTTFCCHYPLTIDNLTNPVPIGFPIANSEMLILDDSLEPTGIGVEGEIYVAGEGLAHGYDRRPSLTAERFVPHPFADRPGSRLYRTGDRGRWRDDGAVEFVGRLDHQVKIRGFRIELAEIEATLSGHEAVAHAIVIVLEPTAGDRRLYAYVVARAGMEPDPEALERHVRDTLPEFMVPAEVIVLPSFPMDPNGKVDRGALPRPPTLSSNRLPIEPATATEAILIEIWAGLLGVERLGPDDDVFRLGAHSLHIVQVAARVLDRFGVEMPVARLFEERSVRRLARVVDSLPRNDAAARSAIVPLPREIGTKSDILQPVHEAGGEVPS